MRRAGFTLLEVLVAMSLLLVLLALASRSFSQSAAFDRTVRQRLPAQQGARGASELLAMELRSSIGPKVNYVPAGQAGALRPELPVSGPTSLTLFLASAGTSYPTVPPSGYPSVTSWPERSMTQVTAPAGCPELETGKYLAVYSTVGTTASSPAQKLADASRILTATAPGCPGGVVQHSFTGVQTYNGNTFLLPVTPVSYALADGVLTRTITGQAPQEVVRDVKAVTFKYQPERTDAAAGCDAAVFYDIPTCTPGAVLITVKVRPGGVDSSATDVTMQQVVFLR